MTPKQIVQKWVEVFNTANAAALIELYHDEAINHQVMNAPLEGKKTIKICFPLNLPKQIWFVS